MKLNLLNQTLKVALNVVRCRLIIQISLTITMSINPQSPPFVFLNWDQKRQKWLGKGGMEIQLIETLGEIFNFSYEIINCNNHWGNLLPNNKWNGIIGELSTEVKGRLLKCHFTHLLFLSHFPASRSRRWRDHPDLWPLQSSAVSVPACGHLSDLHHPSPFHGTQSVPGLQATQLRRVDGLSHVAANLCPLWSPLQLGPPRLWQLR